MASAVSKWEHFILKGEFPQRKRILEGLTVEQATTPPAEGMHTIYDELWHADGWAEIVVNRNPELEKKWQVGEVFPAVQAKTQEEWDELVKHFLHLLDKMEQFTRNTEELKNEEEPGWNTEDYIVSLIIHNSYHLGKIVAMRQIIGAWAPEEQKK
jgi:uncharacterized damage-inducible protein DinB